MSGPDLTDLPAYRSAGEILSHPRFVVARDEYVRAVLALYEHKPSLNRLLLEAGRSVLFMTIICLHAKEDESDRATWPTRRLAIDTAAAFGISSPRSLDSLISQFIDTGYVKARARPRDRRVSVLTPTTKMLAEDLDWLVAHYLPLQVLFPKPGYPRIMQRDPSFQLAQRLIASSFVAHGAQIMASNPVVMQFMGRAVGVMILMTLMRLAAHDSDGAENEIFYSDIGKRFGVSRTHVGKILREAEHGGLVRLRRGHGWFVELTPELVQAFDRFVADSMSGHDLLYQLALRQAA